jgi:hypothetical protein
VSPLTLEFFQKGTIMFDMLEMIYFSEFYDKHPKIANAIIWSIIIFIFTTLMLVYISMVLAIANACLYLNDLEQLPFGYKVTDCKI